MTDRPRNGTVAPEVELDDLRVFAAVAETGGFTEAGRVLTMPKQTVSRRIARLEATLGVLLLHRTSRQVVLTEAGRALAERAIALRRLAREATAAALELGAYPAGTLRVSCDEALATAILSPALEILLQRWPALKAEVLVGPRKVDLLAEGFDLVLRVGPLPDSSLVATKLGPAQVRFVAAPAWIESHGELAHPSQLHDHTCLVHDPGTGPVRWPVLGEDGRLELLSIEPRLRSGSLGLVLDACRRGLGITVLPAFLADAEIEAGRLRPLLDAFAPEVGGVWAITPDRHLQAARVRALLDVLKELGPGSVLAG